MYSDVFLHLSIEWFFKGKCYILPSFELCLRCSKGFGMLMTACTYCHDTYLLKKMLSSTTNMLGVLTVIIATIYGLGWRRQWHPTPVLLPGKSHGRRSLVGCSPWGRTELDTTEQLHFHFHFHAWEKEMATHSSVFTWRFPRTGEPGGLPSLGSHRVGHNWSTLAAAAAAWAGSIYKVCCFVF